MKFRKKPVVIEAMQFTNDAKDRVMRWLNHDAGAVFVEGEPALEIRTLEGVMTARLGDWIIEGVNGEFYPCKPDIFEKTYEPEPTTIDPYCEDIHHRQVYVGNWLTGGGLPDRPGILPYPFQIASIETTNVCIDQHGLRHYTTNYEYFEPKASEELSVDTERLKSLGSAMKEVDCESMANLCCAAADELIALRNSLKCYSDTFDDDQIELERLRSEQAHYSSQHRQLQCVLGTHDSVVELAKKLIAERDAALASAEVAEKELLRYTTDINPNCVVRKKGE